MILHDSVYHLHPHLFDFVLDIFWESVDISFCIRFFCAGNHRLKTASFEAFVLHRFVHPRSHLIKRQIFWHHRGDHQGHLHLFFWQWHLWV